MIEMATLDASTAATRIAGGQLSARELLEACIARIEAHNPRLNALVALNLAQARERADRADQAVREQRVPAGQALLGVPVTIKDAFATHDLPTTAGFPPLRGHRPAQDASVVARLRGAGALILGKSNLSELAGAPHCWNPLFGLTRNPWQPELTPGGSSGGAAAAVAAGFSLLDLGSDIGGSIRIPAAYCGVFGLKATENRIPRSGHIPHLPAHLNRTGRSVRHLLSFGVLGRSVADLHLGYGLIAGPDGLDWEVPPCPAPEPLPAPADARSLRVALWQDFAGTPLCPRTRAAFAHTEEKLRAAGHHTCNIPAPIDVEEAWHGFGLIAGAEIGLGMPGWQRLALRVAAPLLPRDDRLARAFALGQGFDWRRYNQALNRREALIGQLEVCLDDWDAVLCPVAATTPYPGRPQPAHALPPRIPVAGQALPYLHATVAHTVPFSLTGHPVLTLPLGVQDGLPVGAQLIGRRWAENALLAMGARLEAVLGGFVAPAL